MSVFGPAEAATILREATKPFADNGFFGVNATQSRRRGGTDSTSFNEAGLPGIGIQQDPIEYDSHTWHTNLDTYERIIEDDAQQSAMVIAAAVYHLAMRDRDAAAAAEGEDAAVADAVRRKGLGLRLGLAVGLGEGWWLAEVTSSERGASPSQVRDARQRGAAVG